MTIVLQAIGGDGFVGEPGAIAGFPAKATDHAEFGSAATGHVVASFAEFYHGGAVETALPSFLFGYFDKTIGFFVVGTFAAGMPFAVAGTTDFGFAPPTLAISPSAIGTASQVEMYICWFDPRTAASGGAVDAVFSSILMILLVPSPLERVGKQLFYVFQRDII